MNTTLKLYAFLGYMAYLLIKLPMQLYFAVSHSRRTRVVVINQNTELLLVKGWLSNQQWSLPGGGIHKGEKLEAAALRELAEETGLVLPKLTYVGNFKHPDPTVHYAVELFTAQNVALGATTTPKLRRFEVLAMRWFPLDALPRKRSNAVDHALALLQKSRAVNRGIT